MLDWGGTPQTFTTTVTGASAVQAVLELLQEQWNVDQEDHWWLASRRGALRMLEEELKLRVGDLVGGVVNCDESQSTRCVFTPVRRVAPTVQRQESLFAPLVAQCVG